MNRKFFLISTVFLTFYLLTLSGCGNMQNIPSNSPSESTNESSHSSFETHNELQNKSQNDPYNDSQIEPLTEPLTDSLTDPQVEPLTNSQKILQNMTLEEKIGQLFIVHIELLSPVEGKRYSDYQFYTEKMGETLQEYSLGGVIFFGRNLSDTEKTKRFIIDLKTAAKYPLFIAIDEEGGSVSRLKSISDLGSPVPESVSTIGKTNDPENAYAAYNKIGSTLFDLGFNLNFAPVADVQTDPNNTVIGSRSFGADPDLVGEMVASAIAGLHENNILTAAKHFPGHGDASADTHYGASFLTHTMERLQSVEFVPFQHAIEAGTDFIMTAHIKTPNATGNNLCASVSRDILTGVLREKLGYEGIIITDALDMQAITNDYSPVEVAVQVLTAGADMLLMPYNLDEAYNAVLHAVKSGVILEERIDESVLRILDAKIRSGILPNF